VKVYQQSASSIWHAGAISMCKLSSCLYSSMASTDYLNFDIISSYQGNGYAFLIAWDDNSWIQWKQKDNPLTLSADSEPDPLSGDFEFTLVASNDILSRGNVDFHGLSRSWDLGVMFDGRSSMGTWFAIGVTEAANTDITDNLLFGIPGWITGPENSIRHYSTLVKLYVWDPICGNWGNFPTESPTTHFPTVIPPTFQPTTPSPTVSPSFAPTESPTITPTMPPTKFPTHQQTSYPTTLHPTWYPTPSKTNNPIRSVSNSMPTYWPSEFIDSRTFKTPTFTPTTSPTINITLQPTEELSALGTQPVWTFSILYMSLVFFFTGFVLLVCLLLLCNFKKRKSGRETVKKPLKITETTPSWKSAHKKDIHRFRMDKDLLTTAKRNVRHESYRNSNENPLYGYQMPILSQLNSNVEYLERNGVLTMSSPNCSANPRVWKNSPPTIWLNNHVQTFEPMNGKVIMNMVPRTLTDHTSPSNMVGTDQLGIPAQCFCGLRPYPSEPIHSPVHSDNMQLREAGSGTGENLTNTSVTYPSLRIFTSRDGKYLSKSLSRGSSSRSPQEGIVRANTCFSNKRLIGYRSQAGTEYLSNYPVSPPLSEKRFLRKNSRMKKTKQRKSRKQNLKKSVSWVSRPSSSEEEFERTISSKSLRLGDRTPLGPEESDCETAFSSTDDREFSSSTFSVYTSTSLRVHEVKQVKNPWSEIDIVREIEKELEPKNLQVVSKGKDIEWGSSRPTSGLKIAITKETALSNSSKSRSNSRNIIQQREDVRSKPEDQTSLERLSTASSSSESTASSDCRGNIQQLLEHPNYDSLDGFKMNEAPIDMLQASIKIPQNIKELQVWHNNMLKDIPEKHFTEEFLDAGILPPNTLGKGPSKLESQSAVELPFMNY